MNRVNHMKKWRQVGSEKKHVQRCRSQREWGMKFNMEGRQGSKQTV